MNAQTKANRILAVVLTAVFAAVIILTIAASTANKKTAPASDQPPLEPKVEEAEKAEKPAAPAVKEAAEEEVVTRAQKSEPSEKPDEDKAADGKTEEVSASVPAENILPDFILPVEGGIVVKEASPTVPVWSCTMDDYRTHRGVDFAAVPGTTVLAAAPGTVSEVRRDPMMGATVSVRHNGGAETRYQNLTEDSLNLLSVGQTVAAGQPLGAVGETALVESAEENHLHFELLIGGKPEDPAEYLPIVRLSSLTED